jgi:hypothetical protein
LTFSYGTSFTLSPSEWKVIDIDILIVASDQVFDPAAKTGRRLGGAAPLRPSTY